jgi:hypothetical protein
MGEQSRAKLGEVLVRHGITEPAALEDIASAIDAVGFWDALDVGVSAAELASIEKGRRLAADLIQWHKGLTPRLADLVGFSGVRAAETEAFSTRLHDRLSQLKPVVRSVGRPESLGRLRVIERLAFWFKVCTGHDPGRRIGSSTSEVNMEGEPYGPFFNVCKGVFQYANLGDPDRPMRALFQQGWDFDRLYEPERE